MKRTSRILSIILSIMLISQMVACTGNSPNNAAATTQPATTQPADTQPAAAESAATEPTATQPADTQPVTTQPAVAVETTQATQATQATQPDSSYKNETGMITILAKHDNGERLVNILVEYGGLHVSLVFDNLLQCDADGQPVICKLAESYTVSDDALTYTFVLHDGVTWHDGQPFTAEDVVWTIEKSLFVSAIYGVFLTDFLNIEGAKDFKEGNANHISGIVVDGNTITLKLLNSSATLLWTLANWTPLPKHLLENADPATMHLNEYWQNPIGTGMYAQTDLVKGEYFILTRYDGYYGEKPKIKTVKCSVNNANALAMALSGELDFIWVMDESSALSLREAGVFELQDIPRLYYRVLTANTMGKNSQTDGNELIGDLRVRQAFSYTIDRKAYVEAFFPKIGTVMDTFVPTSMTQYFNNDVETFAYNPEKAQELLNEANFDFSQTIQIITYYTDTTTEDILNQICADLSAIGVKAEWSNIAGQDAAQVIYFVRNYDFCYSGIASSSLQDAYSMFISTNEAEGHTHMLTDESAMFDSLYAQLNSETDPAKLKDILYTLQELESQVMWYLPLFNINAVTAWNTNRINVTCAKFGNENFNYDHDFQNWTLK